MEPWLNVDKPRRGCYDSLADFLACVPMVQQQLALSLDELEERIGRDLPKSARRLSEWWANATDTHSQAKAWSSAGWEVCAVFLEAQPAVVVLRRPGCDPIRRISEAVGLLLTGRALPYRLDETDLARLIRLCKLLGWYFEGTVLYERASGSRAGLSEADQAEIEEDYSVCKRELNRFRAIHTEPEE